jgi:phosphoglycolate phosphatase
MFSDKNLKLIIFDFDGVIVESNGIKDKAFRKIFDRFPAYSEDIWAYHTKNVSASRYAKFDYILEKTGRQGDEILKNELLSDFSNDTLELMKSVSFVAGAKDFLAHMQGKLPLYLLSVTPQEDLDKIIAHLNIRSYFKDVYGCPPWNKPKAIKDIIAKENILPGEVVMVGDSYGDQRAALETGIHFVGRNSGLGFEDPQPECIIPDLTHLFTVLKIAAA